MATDQQIEDARNVVRRALLAADNANHAGEQAVLLMAASLRDMPLVALLTPDQVKRARDLREDPDSEDNERFASWFGDTLLDVHEAFASLAGLRSPGVGVQMRGDA